MAKGDGQNFGSVLFQSLAQGVKGVQAGLQEKRQNDLQNLMTGLQVQRAEQEQQAFIQQQQINDVKLQEANQNLKLSQIKLTDMLKSPAQLAEEKAQADAITQQAEMDRYVNQYAPISLVGPINPDIAPQVALQNQLASLPTNGIGFSIKNPFGTFSSPAYSKTKETDDGRLYRLLGKDAYLSYKLKGSLTEADFQKAYLQYQIADNQLQTPEGLSYQQWKSNLGFDNPQSTPATESGWSDADEQRLKELEALDK